MIDTHCHIDTEAYNTDRNEVLDSAYSSGVEYIIVPAIEPKTFGRLLEVVNSDKRLFCGLGVHPHNSLEYNQEVEDTIQNLIDTNKSKVVAIGEVGLDYYYDFSPKEVQKDVFTKQIKLAKHHNLPMIIHNRDSDEDLMNILEKEQDGNLKAVLHCFSGGIDMMEHAIRLGFHLSFTGNITFKKSLLNKVVEKTDMNRILLETDSPWMTPPPNRGKRNEPKNVRLVAEKIAEIKSLNIDEVIKMTTQNAKKFFGLMSLLFLFSFASLSAQGTTTVYDDEYEEYEETEEAPDDLYPRTLGFGPVFGTNTIVDSYSDGQDISNEGLFAVGGAVNYRFLPYLIGAASYTYSKNSKYVERYKIDPNIHNSIEISGFLSPNPYSRVNFYGILGLSYMMNKYASRVYDDPKFPTGKKVYTDKDYFAVNTGLGFSFNIDFESAGIMSIMAEWKLNFVTSSTDLDYDPRKEPGTIGYDIPTSVSTFYSIPRVAIIWYPKF